MQKEQIKRMKWQYIQALKCLTVYILSVVWIATGCIFSELVDYAYLSTLLSGLLLLFVLGIFTSEKKNFIIWLLNFYVVFVFSVITIFIIARPIMWLTRFVAALFGIKYNICSC
jgi:hypothetical protein